jgi:hypothetical protein
MGKFIVSISNKMQSYTVYLYMEITLTSSRQDSTQAGTEDTNTNRGHTTTYQYRHMTKRAAETW